MARPSITFLAGEHVERCRHEIDKHFSEYQTLQYMAEGHVALRIDDRAYALNGRWFWSAYPGPRIAFRVAPPSTWWEHRYIAFRGPMVERWIADGLFPVAPQAAPAGGGFGRRFDEVLETAKQPGRWPSTKAAHLIESILIDLAEARSTTPTPDAWTARATRELTSTAGHAIDYAALSEKLGTSTRTLRRNFRQRLGTSPHQYLITQRVAAARELLLRTDLPIKEIARQLGYNDVFYFGRQFKKVAGVSPASFRRSREG